jgi:hypothetical protein
MTPADDSVTPAQGNSLDRAEATGSPEGAVGSESATDQSESSISLAPIQSGDRDKKTPERLIGDVRHLDLILAGLVLAFGFFLGSFAARNPDMWLHLADGRLIAHGHFSYEADPFVYTSTTWVNHSWLWDLMLFGLSSLGGGPETVVGGALLVIFKALLVTALAWVMMQTRRRGVSLWASAACAALALLTLSPRLFLQPTVVSLLFLSITLCVLQHPTNPTVAERRRGEKQRSPLLVYWVLPPLFVLWVNLDSWFLLGPFTIALYLLGQGLQKAFAPIRTGPDAPEPKQLAALTIVLVVGLGACLLNPWHYRAFTLPMHVSLSGAADALSRDVAFQRLFMRADQEYLRPDLDASIATLAYIPLVFAGLGSFVLTWGLTWRWWRCVVWLAFFALSVYRIRDIPIFAVVAGPITALNLQDFAAIRVGQATNPDHRAIIWSLGGRVATLAAALLLVLADWPGWLHIAPRAWLGEGRSQHRVEWTVEVDPSLRNAAEQLRAWHQSGQLGPNDHGFNYSWDIAPYCAWFGADDNGLPPEKMFFDIRFESLDSTSIKELTDARQTLRNYSDPPENLPGEPENWEKIFKKHDINHVVLTNVVDVTYLRAWTALLRDWQQWSLLYMDGRTTIFGWNRAGQAPAIPRLDFEQQAFAPGTEAAPVDGPGRGPVPPDLWTRYAVGPAPLPLAQQAAAYDAQYWVEINVRSWKPQVLGIEVANWSGVVGQSMATSAAATVSAPATLALSSFPNWSALGGSPYAKEVIMRFKPQGPFAALVAAVRAGRSAIASDPDAPACYFILGRAYSQLWRAEENSWCTPAPFSPDQYPRQKLRFVQLVAALEHGLKARPDDADAHFQLWESYRDMHFMDLATDHLREFLKATRAAGPRPGESREDLQRYLEELEKGLKNNETEVLRALNDYDLKAGNQPLGTKVQQALAHQLGKQALELLMTADSSQMDVAERVQQFDLLLMTGRPEEIVPEDWSPLLGTTFDWFGFLRGAAMGDYHEAGSYLDQIIARLDKSNPDSMAVYLRAQAFPPPGHIPGDLRAINSVINNVRNLAELRVARGMLAVEQGDISGAKRHFRKALDASGSKSFFFPSRPIAYQYLTAINRATAKQ